MKAAPSSSSLMLLAATVATSTTRSTTAFHVPFASVSHQQRLSTATPRFSTALPKEEEDSKIVGVNVDVNVDVDTDADDITASITAGLINDFSSSTRDSALPVAQLAIDPDAAGTKPIKSDTDETVNAVLAAAGEAVMAAEANLQLAEHDAAHNDAHADEIDIPVVIEPLVQPQQQEQLFDAPNVRKILKFAIPAIGVWLCGPLLSLIDTSAVGILSGTAQQAALNPAVAVTDYAALLIAFMYTGTTNLVSAARTQDRNTTDKPVTTRTLIGAMQLSTFVGAGLGTILFVFARPLLQAIIGANSSVSPAVISAAMKYVRIRALGMPAAAIIGSAQAACLGMQDIKSPLYVLAAAAIVNFFGDVIFVGSSNAWIGGAAGAAWATVFSQYAAVALFVKWLTHASKKKVEPVPATVNSNGNDDGSAPKTVNLSKAIMEMTGKPTSKGKTRRSKLQDALVSFKAQKQLNQEPSKNGVRSKLARVLRKSKTNKPVEKKSEDNFTVRGFLNNRFKMTDLLTLPRKDIVKEFSPYLMPVTSTQFGRVSGYVAMSHVVASSLGTVSMAAQQVVVSLFYCLCPIADSLSLTAQSFVPSIAEQEKSKGRALALRKTTINFLKAGGIMGAAIVGAVLSIPLISGFFTADPAVVALVNSVVPMLVGFFMVHGWMCASEGLLLGQTDLGFLGKMYAVFCVAVPALMMRVKHAALTGIRPANLASVWTIFLGYQLVRVAIWVGRVAQLQRRTEREVMTDVAI